MMTLRASVFALLVSGSAAFLAPGCGVGDASGPGGGTDQGDGSGDGDGNGDGDGQGDGTGEGDGEDEGNGEDGGDDGGDSSGGGSGEVQCATEYSVSGSVEHDEEVGGTCDGNGRWDVTVSAPFVDADSEPCDNAPEGESFSFSVTSAGNGHAVEEDGGSGLTWTVQVRDKSGACSATFESNAAGVAAWALIPGEDGAGGPLGGTARFERRGP